MKFLGTTIFLAVLSFLSNAQKTNLSIAEVWNAAGYSFNDGSYLVNYNGKINDDKWERVLEYYDATGKKVNEQKLPGNTQWDFANDVKKFPGKEAVHSVIDPEKKVCYTLYGSPKDSKVYITGVDFKPTSFPISSEPFKVKSSIEKYYGSYDRLRSFYSYINAKGNPTWLIQYRSDGMCFITFDLATKKETIKMIKTEEIYNLHYKFIGRYNNKAWLVKFSDWGVDKPSYELKFFSISDDGELKAEFTQQFSKDQSLGLSKFNRVYAVEKDQTCFITVSHHEGKVTLGGIKEVDFIKFDGKVSVVKWKTKMLEYYFNVPEFSRHIMKNNTVRFCMDDRGKKAFALDVDYEKNQVTVAGNIELANQQASSRSRDVYNCLLYWDELKDTQKKLVEEINLSPTDVQYVFPNPKNGHFIVRGHHFFNEEKEDWEVNAEVIR